MSHDRARTTTMLLLAACAAALTGCAGIETAVRAHAAHDFATGVRTYAIAQDSAAVPGEERRRYVSAIERRLAQLGFVAEQPTTGRYRVAVSYETHPVSIAIGYTRCVEDIRCGTAMLPRGFEWPAAQAYLHSLTLRFFDREDGREAYKVSVTKRDRDADARRDIDGLVASALARLPFAGAGESDDLGDRTDESASSDWKVTLRRTETASDSEPYVTAIAPLVHY